VVCPEVVLAQEEEVLVFGERRDELEGFRLMQEEQRKTCEQWQKD